MMQILVNLLNISEADIFLDFQCDCKSYQNYTQYVDHHHKHVCMGNLNIIDKSELKNLMRKSTTFRECPPLDLGKLVTKKKNLWIHFV